MSIQEDIEQWDGKSAADISAVYIAYYQDDDFLSSIINLFSEVSLQKGATWLLKKHLENKNEINELETSRIYKNIENLEHWESKLHFLQALPFLLIPQKDKQRIEHFLRKCLMEKNKFVKAWAYNGFYELAIQYPEHAEETKKFFDLAMCNEAPSVKSRIRTIMKKGF